MKTIINYRIRNIPVLPLFLTMFWLLVVSWLWTGTLFNGNTIPNLDWLAENGLVEADVNGMPLGWQLLGISGTVFEAWGLYTLLSWRKARTARAALQTGVLASIFFALPIVMLTMVFRPEHNVTLFLMNISKYIVAWGSTALLLWKFVYLPAQLTA